jgi:transcriptional regulator with XRE-family HTH domain
MRKKTQRFSSKQTRSKNAKRGRPAVHETIHKATSLLCFLRTRSGMSQAELAAAAGVKVMDIARTEMNTSNLRADKLIALAGYFHISVDALVRNNFAACMAQLEPPARPERKLQERIRQAEDRKTKVGIEGEDWVFQHELERLKGTLYENAVNPNYSEDCTAHFDILSFDPVTGERIIMEVKSTEGDEDLDFFMTDSEWDLANECEEKGIRYELHRVFHLNSPDCTEHIYTSCDLKVQFEKKPSQYRLTKKHVA